VLPLLNALLPNAIAYQPLSSIHTLRRRPGSVTFYPQPVLITQVAGLEDGLDLLSAVCDLPNRT
jgi:hypothetical protein